MPTSDILFGPDFLRRLEQLRLVVTRAAGGRLEGARLGRADGGLTEIKGHRSYSAGDDLRFVDWSMYARLDRLFVRQLVREEAAEVAVLIDGSASMAAGTPSKYTFAARLGVALAYVGLVSQDVVRCGVFRDGQLPPLAPRTGRAAVQEFMQALARSEPAGTTGLAAALKATAESLRRPATLIVLSDFWEDLAALHDPAAPASDQIHLDAPLVGVLRHLAARGYDVVLAQVLAREEVEPPPPGRYNLTDVESGRALPLTVTAETRAQYIQYMARTTDALRELANRCGMRTFHLVSDTPFEQGLLDYLRAGRAVR